MKRLTISLPEEMYEKLKQRAEENDRSMSKEAVHLLRQPLMQEQGEGEEK